MPRTILFSGMLAGDPHQGGATWAVLQFLLGFRRLGHDVWFVEPVKPGVCPESADYFRHVTSFFGLEGRAALLVEATRETIGLSYDALVTAARRADILINVSGMLTDPGVIADIPVRAYLDLDP